VVYAHQNIRTFRREVRGEGINYGVRELLVLAILQLIADAFHRARHPWSAERLSERLDVPMRIVRELLNELAATGYLIETAGDELSYQPARELEKIAVRDLLVSLRNYGTGSRIVRNFHSNPYLQEILASIDSATRSALAHITLLDLAESMEPSGATAGGSGGECRTDGATSLTKAGE
jgi:membrane protein